MADLKLLAIEEVVAACQQGAPEAAAALSRAFGGQFKLQVQTPEVFKLRSLPEGFSGPGLVVALTIGSAAVLVLLPEQSGVIPVWYAAPDASGESRLTTLAQELAMVLLPEAYMADSFRAARVARLVETVTQSGVLDGSMVLPLELCAGDTKRAMAMLVWPATRPQMVFEASAASGPDSSAIRVPKAHEELRITDNPSCGAAAPIGKQSGPPAAARRATPPLKKPSTVRDLPIYSQSLLRIRVPVVVTLARKRQPLGRVIELGPGSIIHFDKSCEEMLDLEAGGLMVARGEAVKVGDKFGLRLTSVVLPEERFQPVRPMESGIRRAESQGHRGRQ
jgi:flagellar motor switch/type III secretory pathway protein FliN